MLNLPHTGQRLRAAAAAELVGEVNRNHIIAGQNVRLRRTPAGTVIDVTAGGGAGGAAGSHPWKVRYHAPPPEEDGGSPQEAQWEVYLPAGTLTIGSNCYVMNDPAGSTDGHDGEDGWYVLPLKESTSGTKTYHIVAHGKGNASMSSGGSYSVAAPFVMVAAEEIGSGGEAQHHPLQDDTLKKHYAGDCWSAVIATVTVTVETEDGETQTSRRVRQAVKAAVDVPAAAPTYFRPLWELSYNGSDADDPLEVVRLTLEDRKVYVGGVATEAADTELKNDGDTIIYLTIDTSGAKPKATLSVVGFSDTQPEGSATSQPVEIFLFSANRMTVDLRANLSNLPYYRGIA